MLKSLQSLVINKIKTICKRLNSQSFLDIPELTAFFLELILIEDKRKYQDLLKSYFLLWNSIDYVYSLLIYGKLKKRITRRLKIRTLNFNLKQLLRILRKREKSVLFVMIMAYFKSYFVISVFVNALELL